LQWVVTPVKEERRIVLLNVALRPPCVVIFANPRIKQKREFVCEVSAHTAACEFFGIPIVS
jgi:hypothetical protein